MKCNSKDTWSYAVKTVAIEWNGNLRQQYTIMCYSQQNVWQLPVPLYDFLEHICSDKQAQSYKNK